MDTAFDENQTVFRISVFAVTFQMLADSNSFLYQMVKIFGFAGSKTFGFHDAEDFAAGDEPRLSNTMRITKNDTCADKRRRCVRSDTDIFLPICEGVKPFFASLQIWSTTSSDVNFNHYERRKRDMTSSSRWGLTYRWDCSFVGQSRVWNTLSKNDRDEVDNHNEKENYPGACIRPMLTVV